MKVKKSTIQRGLNKKTTLICFLSYFLQQPFYHRSLIGFVSKVDFMVLQCQPRPPYLFAINLKLLWRRGCVNVETSTTLNQFFKWPRKTIGPCMIPTNPRTSLKEFCVTMYTSSQKQQATAVVL